MPYTILQVPERGVLDAYEKLLAERGYTADEAQRAAAECLQKLYSELLAFKVRRRGALRKMLSRAAPPKGVYFWGGVGRGKSFLMDCFYEAVPYRRKKRIHFHAFMRGVHQKLESLRGSDNPMQLLGEQIARETRLLCFDEFHVSDIADAMILGRLMQTLFERGVVLVMTSNYPPDGLYPNGLQRSNFLPTIDLLKKQLTVIQVDAGIDYRLRTLEQVEIYHHPADAEAENKMASYFKAIAGEEGERSGEIEILGRKIPVRRQARGVIWFDFEALCDGPRSQNDYLELVGRYHTILISGIPKIGVRRASEARRFTWLVDICYDHRVKLIATAACPPEEIYTEGTQASEFQRTVSRLTEMRSREYLALPHIAETFLEGGKSPE